MSSQTPLLADQEVAISYQTSHTSEPQSQDGQICSNCLGINVEGLLRHRHEAWSERPISMIYPPQGANVNSSCPFCRLLARSIPPEHWRSRRKLHLRDFGNAQTLDGKPCTLYGFEQGKERSLRIIPLAEDAHRIGKAKYGFARPLQSDAADKNLIKGWLETCESAHAGCRTAEKELRESTQGTAAEYMVNVRDMRMEVVAENDSPRYFALSYVWGGTEQLQLLRENITALQCAGSLQAGSGWEIPRTIRDAMTLTRELGETYLWVDALCIYQDDPEHKERQIKRMNMIYKHATLTIVAVDAKSASAPLPGVRGYSIPRRRHEESFKGIRLQALQPSLEEWISDIATDGVSRWSQRLWTYQEELLSRRLLFMTSTQAYFSCLTSEYSEDTYDAIAPKTSSLHYGRLLHTELDPVQRRLIWAMLVQNYSSRHSTFAVDRGFGFQGIAEEMGRLWKYPTIYGIPEDRIPFALSWRHGKYPFPKRPGPARIPEWPSWSWMGWSGEVSFPNYHFYRSAIREIRYSEGGKTAHTFRFPARASDIHDKSETVDTAKVTQEDVDLEQGVGPVRIRAMESEDLEENATMLLPGDETAIPAIPILSFEASRAFVNVNAGPLLRTGRLVIKSRLEKSCGFLYTPHHFVHEGQVMEIKDQCECILLGTSRRPFAFSESQYQSPAKPTSETAYDDLIKAVFKADKTRNDTAVQFGYTKWSELAMSHEPGRADFEMPPFERGDLLKSEFYVILCIKIVLFSFFFTLAAVGLVVRLVVAVAVIVFLISVLFAVYPIRWTYYYCIKPLWSLQDWDAVAHVMWIEDRGTHYERVAVGEMRWKSWVALEPKRSLIRLG